MRSDDNYAPSRPAGACGEGPSAVALIELHCPAVLGIGRQAPHQSRGHEWIVGQAPRERFGQFGSRYTGRHERVIADRNALAAAGRHEARRGPPPYVLPRLLW
jgi:hypothetical protein